MFKLRSKSPFENTDLTKKSGFGPRASKGSDDQSKEVAKSKYEMGEYKNDPTKPPTPPQGLNNKVMKDGPKTNTVVDSKIKDKVEGGVGNWQPHSQRKRNAALPYIGKKLGPMAKLGESEKDIPNERPDFDKKSENKEKTDKYKLVDYVPGVDGPKYIGGSAPNPAKTVVNILKTAKNAYNFITKG